MIYTPVLQRGACGVKRGDLRSGFAAESETRAEREPGAACDKPKRHDSRTLRSVVSEDHKKTTQLLI
jgi:hypothetical protein